MNKEEKRTLLASLKKVRENPDGTEDWMLETPFQTVTFGFIKFFEKQSKVKGLSFDSVKIDNGRLVFYFVRKPWKYVH